MRGCLVTLPLFIIITESFDLNPPSPRFRRVLRAFISVAAYSAEVAILATKAGSYGVFGDGE